MAKEEQRRTTRKDVLAIMEAARRDGWTDLDLHQSIIRRLPEWIGELTTLESLDLSDCLLGPTLPESISQLTNLQTLNLSHNRLEYLPDCIGQLTNLRTLDLRGNSLTSLPESIGELTKLETLILDHNHLESLPESFGQLAKLRSLSLDNNRLRTLPESIGHLASLRALSIGRYSEPLRNEATAQRLRLRSYRYQLAEVQALDPGDDRPRVLSGFGDQYVSLGHFKHRNRNELTSLPESFCRLTSLHQLHLRNNELTSLPECIGQLSALEVLDLSGNELISLPDSIGRLKSLRILDLYHNQLTSSTQLALSGFEDYMSKALPQSLGHLNNLWVLDLSFNQLAGLPASLGRLIALETLKLDRNPLHPALQSAYDAGLPELMAYLRSLDEAELLHEAKLLLVGEGGVGKTTLLKALMGRKREEPREGEPTTHGVRIDIHALHLDHPEEDGVKIRLNAWDFGGQEVYRVTHQFFFSRRSLYLLVWEPRRGAGQCQVEDWLKLIRLRVGDDARVLIISTHSRTGERIARIDRPVLLRDFGSMIVGFHEVDSLVDDPDTGEKVGIAELKQIIAGVAAGLEQMGMPLNLNWTAARDELLDRPEPRISYGTFAQICASHGLAPIDAETLAHLMHDLGYIVYYADDERLRDDVVLQPEWLTKAIGFVLEDRTTQEMDGILPDSRLREVWHDHPFQGETRYEPILYSFFLRLMEKYDVSYRLLDGTATLVAQHVPQVRPDLPWLPEQVSPDDVRRIAMVCAMDEDPPGLVPWMIVRTHDYAAERECDDGNVHRLHWQKGMFLGYPPHGEAVLEQRGREFHIYAQAEWPEYFMNVLQHTLHKLITDNWPGMEGRYRFTVPCAERSNGQPCKGRFNIDALRQFLTEGDRDIRCQECRKRQSISELLFGFEDTRLDKQLQRIEEGLAGLESRIANYFMALMHAMADEAKHGPRLFTIEPVDEGWHLALRRLVSTRLRLRLWCEAEGQQHKVFGRGVGVYEFDTSFQWVQRVLPYASFVLRLLKTVLPVAAPALDILKGESTAKGLGIEDHLEFLKELSKRLPPDVNPAPLRPEPRSGILTAKEHSSLLAMHSLLRELDPNQEKLGLTRVPTYTGDYRWLCRKHYREWEPKIPDTIE